MSDEKQVVITENGLGVYGMEILTETDVPEKKKDEEKK